MGTLPQLKIIGTCILFFIFSQSYIFSQTDVESLLDSLEVEIEKRKYPSLMISIVRSDTILFSGGIGYADVENKRKVDELTLFRQGSISKSFTALALLKALHDQGLSLHTPIKKIDSELPITNKWTDQSPVTVAHVLEHTTGFDGWHTHAMYNFTDSVSPSGKAMVLSHQNSLKSRWKPGTIHAYNNPGYVIAGHLVEVLTGKSYQEYVKQEILTPIGMGRSAFYFKRPQNVPIAKGYNLEREGYVEVPFVSIQGGSAGGLCANAHDMSNYLQFMLNRKGALIDSALFDESTFERIENSHTTLSARNGLKGGYGLGNFQVYQKGYVFHGHNGGIDGFSSRYIYSREADLGIAIASNTIRDVTPLMEYILDYLLGDENILPVDRAVVPLSKSEASEFEGFYVFKDLRILLRSPIMHFAGNFRFQYQNGHLYVKDLLGGIRDSLSYAGGNKFYRNIEKEPSVVFFKNEQGKQAVGIKRKYAEKESFVLNLFDMLSVLASMMISLGYLAYFGIWFLIQLVNRKPVIELRRLSLFMACISFPLMFFSFAMSVSDRITSGSLTIFSGMFFISSIIMVIATLWSIFQIRGIKEERWFNIYFAISTLAISIVTIFFISHDFIVLRLLSN